MSVGNKPGAIGKPRSDNFPVHLFTFKLLRLRDDACLARRDELETDTIRVTICHVFAVWRDCSAQDTILKRVGCELPQLQLRWRLSGRRPDSVEPENCACDQKYSDDSDDTGNHRPPSRPKPRLFLLYQFAQFGTHFRRGLL